MYTPMTKLAEKKQCAIPLPPQSQGLSSPTFRVPPLDGSPTIPEIYAWHLQHSPNHRVFVIAAIYTGARLMKRRIQFAAKPPVVAILSLSGFPDTITYFVTMIRLLHANYVFFPISPRNSPVAVAHLLHKIGLQYVLVGRDASMQDLANEALEILKSQYSSDALPELSPIPVFEDYFQSQWEQIINTELDLPLLIPWFGERDLCDVLFSFHAVPMYHGMGDLQFLWTASSGFVIGAFEPKSPVIFLTPENLFQSARTVQSDVIFCVPSFIEAWSRWPEYVEWLSTRSGVLYSGGPLNKEAGDYMTRTEGGVMSPILPGGSLITRFGIDGAYLCIPRRLRLGLVKLEMVPGRNNSHELVMVSNPFCQPSVLNTKVNGADAYASLDLFIPHATTPGFWKVFGRTDDQIMHNTGEKTNPGPLGIMLNQDPHILALVMFGRGKFQAGVPVEPKREFSFDPADTVLLGPFRNQIWPSVERMNAPAPQHSRLFKEMILVAKPDKPFTYTAKKILHSTRSHKTVEESTQTSISLPLEWNAKSTGDFVLSHSILDDDDLFQHGCDSLQSMWIRNSLFRALRDTVQLDTRQTTDNFVYTHPTISKLAVFLYSLARGKLDAVRIDPDSRVKAMHGMVKKYTKGLPTSSSGTSSPATSGKIVLVTGTMGPLRSHILASLVLDTSVDRVYAVNRLGKLALSERQREAFVSRGLNVDLLYSDKAMLVQADISEETDFFDEYIDSTLKNSCLAWRVDFNLSLSSFESNIRGLHASEDDSLTECPIVPEIALGTGYGESKWVSEELLRTTEGLRYLVICVGQPSGAANGTWNVNGWVPAMVQSATKVGCGDRTISLAIVDRPEDSIHLVHPEPLNVKLVPYIQWFGELEKSALGSVLPAFRILPYYRHSTKTVNFKDREAFGFPRITVRDMAFTQIGREDVER
ncbi:hypothetical protein DFS33DRAFT_1371246 [Desarmillaria ectypa]|nr:hypothetical protein DFS33DRAFT_1371246 [Desarmillaria ectypa]